MAPSSRVGIYSIRAVSRMTDIPVSTLRYWESSYGLVKPQRTEGGHRLYSQDDVQRLAWLKARIDEGLQTGAAHRLLVQQLEETGDLIREARRRDAIMIMVAERDPITAELEQYFLSEAGYQVHLILDGRKAAEEAQAQQPDLIIVDVILPGKSGLKVCQAIKANPKTSGIPVLVFSAVDARDAAMRVGADAFLLKPLEQPRLIECVREMLVHDTPSGVRT